MRKQITRLSLHQTSKVIATMHALMLTIFVVLPGIIGSFVQHQLSEDILLLLATPFIIWLVVYIGCIIACWFYNLVVPLTGGVEFTLNSTELKDAGLVEREQDIKKDTTAILPL